MTDFHEHPQHSDAANEGRRGFHVRMGGRDQHEHHRAATPLELFFDLVFVVAVASLVFELAHGLSAGHFELITPYLMVFFAIWWAWMNFTWFASAYDTDDALYRILTVVQMAGVLVLAAGVPRAFEEQDFGVIVIGYLVMRIGLVGQWIRAAIEHPERRATALRYAIGVTVVQTAWIARAVFTPFEWVGPAFVVLALAELAVPLWAERAGATPWHPRHLAERYGLFTIILLGEGVLAATNAVKDALSSGVSTELVVIALATLVLLVGLWWTYFLQPAAEGLRKHREWSYFWGYGHYVLFACIAGVGAALEVAVEAVTNHSELPDSGVGFVLAVPVAVTLLLLWVLYIPFSRKGEIPPRLLVPAAGLVLLAPFAAAVIGVVGVVIVITLIVAAVVVGTTIVRQPTRVDNGSGKQP